jgi:predicted RNase H-like HicB family nuclease
MMTDEISKKSIEILGKPYARRLVPNEAGGYVASIQEFPGCIAEGNSAKEALQNLDNAAASWIEAALSTGYEIRDPISFDGYSGKVALRIPRGLHKQVAELAESEESSINQLLVAAISQYVSGSVAFKGFSEVALRELGNALQLRAVSFSVNNFEKLVFPGDPNNSLFQSSSTYAADVQHLIGAVSPRRIALHLETS